MAKKPDLILIKHIRKTRKLSQRAMADMLGVDQATVSKIEAGKLTPSKTLSILLAYVAAT